MYPEPFGCRQGLRATHRTELSQLTRKHWMELTLPPKGFLLCFDFFSPYGRSNIYLNIWVNTQCFVRTLYECWILKDFKCTMKLEKFSCMLREVAKIEDKVTTRSDRNYKSWKNVVWPTNILPLMSIKFYSAGSAWKLRSKCVSCSPALMVSAWGGKKAFKKDGERFKSELRCFFLFTILQIQK